MSKRLIALIIGALAVGLIAGCGAGSDDSGSSVTKTAFIKQSDAICVKTRNRIETEFEGVLKKLGSLEKSKTAGAYAAANETILIPDLKREVEEIEALGIPSGDEEEINAILDETKKGTEELESDSAIATQRPPALETANKLADKYGFKVCVQS